MKHTELPTFEATWWPVVLETIPGSAERIVAGIVVRSESGQSQARQIIPPATLIAMFGSAGKGMQLVIANTLIDLQQQLNAGTHVKELEFPYGGIVLGTERDCLAHDLNEVFEIAVRLSSAFGISTFGNVETVGRETKMAFNQWAEEVRAQTLMTTEATLAGAFNVKVKWGTRKQTRIGFVYGGYVANFGMLRPVFSSGDTRALKLKIFDLNTYSRTHPLAVESTELIVGVPLPPGDDKMARRELEGLNSSWEFIMEEARARDVVPVRCARPADAANHLMQHMRRA